MFSFFKKSSAPVVTDKVFKTRASCNRGVVAEAILALKQGKAPVIFFFFEEARQSVAQFLDENNIAHQLIARGSSSSAKPNEPFIYLTDAFSDVTTEISRLPGETGRSSISALFYGHYPLTEPEEKALESLKPAIGSGPYLFFLSLEDGLMTQFGAGNIGQMMDKLGMAEDEAIAHNMVSRAIRNAREKLDKKVQYDMKTRSERDWFAKNGNL